MDILKIGLAFSLLSFETVHLEKLKLVYNIELINSNQYKQIYKHAISTKEDPKLFLYILNISLSKIG